MNNSHFLHDRRGASLVTYALVLPLLILVIFGAATVWRVLSIKESMDLATYEAARYLSQVGRDLGNRPGIYYDVDAWEREAHERVDDWVQGQILRNPFVGGEDTLEITIRGPVELDCTPWLSPRHNRAAENVRFTVSTSLRLQSAVEIPFMSSWTFTLHERHSDLVECPRYFNDPPEEGDVF
ncbi:MAG: hypothetical protein MAG451_02551 [Anaerolineales bacterium]|nr:hypothetical protein [Anaerolineales bacterium]